MTEADSEAPSQAGAGARGETPAPAPGAGAGARQLALGLVAALILVLAILAPSPYWAPPVAKILPWGGREAVSPAQYAALAQRLDRVEAALAAAQQQRQASEAQLRELTAPLAAARQQRQASEAQLRELTARLAAADALSAKAQRELARLASEGAGLGERLSAVEKQLRGAAASQSAAPLLVALLQIREAVEAGRPFPNEYAALMALARDRPDIAAAAAPLAPAAQDGVASRAVLRQRLDDLAAQLAAAPTPAPKGWGAQALARLRGLVTIRRIDGAQQSGPEAAVAAAEKALATGDLDGAVKALAPLNAAEAWLRQARARLAVGSALSRLQTLLAAPIGNAAPQAKAPP